MATRLDSVPSNISLPKSKVTSLLPQLPLNCSPSSTVKRCSSPRAYEKGFCRCQPVNCCSSPRAYRNRFCLLLATRIAD